MLIEFRFDENIRRTSMWRVEKITEQDLTLVRALDVITWDGGRESDDLIVKYGKWTISTDRTAVFNSAGGGSFEIPEMYDLYPVRNPRDIEIHLRFHLARIRKQIAFFDPFVDAALSLPLC